MAVKTGAASSIRTNTNEQVKRRDEQIRRVLNAAQYKKYKETEKLLRATVTQEVEKPKPQSVEVS
jgi:hypothetical protein